MANDDPHEVSESAYAGILGSTRHETFLVSDAEGTAQPLDALVAVNVESDPDLATDAAEGRLHTLPSGVSLAIPYVYHDPRRQKFALVVPVVRAHDEFRLRVELLQKLASDGSVPVPEYVREARVVIGTDGLRAYLGEDSSGRSARALREQRAAIEEQERRNEARAAQLERRHRSLEKMREDFEAQRSDLAMREADLEKRIAELLEREERVASEERALLANVSALRGRERMLETREQSMRDHDSTLRRSMPPEETLEAEPFDTDSVRPSERDSAPPVEPIESLAPLAADDASFGEEVDEIDAPAAWAGGGHDAYAAVIDGEVHAWLRGDPERMALLGTGSVRPIVQIEPESTLPIGVMAIVAEPERRGIARVALDVSRPDDRAVVESLAREFRVRVHVVNAEGRDLGHSVIADPSEAHAREVFAILAARSPGSESDRKLASGRLSRDDSDDPDDRALATLLYDEGALTRAASVDDAMQRFQRLRDDEARARFALGTGVSRAAVDVFTRRLVLAALRTGVGLPRAVVARAIELGLVPDEKTLAQRALHAFERTCDGGLDAIGRDRADAYRVWLRLAAWGKTQGLELTTGAVSAMRALYDFDDPDASPPPDPRARPDRSALGAMSDDELASWIGHPELHTDLIDELGKRDPAASTALFAAALRTVSEESAAELGARLSAHGDLLGDFWVELLAARKVQAAAVAAIAVTAIRLRRGLGPLIARVLDPEVNDWEIFAWAAGEFGAAAVRILTRANEGETARIATILAHALRAGASLDERTIASGTRLARNAAEQAPARVAAARAFDGAMRRGEAMSPGARIGGAMLARISSDRTGQH